VTAFISGLELREWTILFTDGSERIVQAHGMVTRRGDAKGQHWVFFETIPDAAAAGRIEDESVSFDLSRIAMITPPID
jgi:hypothetical protein